MQKRQVINCGGARRHWLSAALVPENMTLRTLALDVNKALRKRRNHVVDLDHQHKVRPDTR
jgi:hypothetical protein